MSSPHTLSTPAAFGRFSIFEAAKGSNTGLDPLLLIGEALVVGDAGALGGHLHPHDKVCRVAGRGKDAAPREDLVDGQPVDTGRRRLPVLLGLEFDEGHGAVQLLGQGVLKHVSLGIPAGALEEEAPHEAPVFRSLDDALPVLRVSQLKPKADGVDGVLVPARVILKARDAGAHRQPNQVTRLG